MRITARSVGVSLLFALALVVGGCASAKASNETRSDVGAGSPRTIYVGAFDLGQATVKSDPGTLTGRPRLLNFRKQDPTEELEKMSDLLAEDIVSDLRKAKLSAERLAAGSPRPTSGWLVRGDFLELQEGNRMQKAVVGFGAGNSDAKLYVTIADLSKPHGQDLLDFNVDSSGNQAPGGGATAVATHSPWGMAGKFVMERNASEKDIRRAAEQIADEIARLAAKNAGAARAKVNVPDY